MQSILRPLRHFISLALRPTLDALWYGRHLPWNLRWRLLAFQPLHVLGNISIIGPYVFFQPFTVDYIPVALDREVRVLVFRPPENGNDKKADTASSQAHALRPLHITCHGGGFIGGYPESEAQFCTYLAASTGAIIISLSYHLAPVHPFPAAIDDIDAAVAWLRKNAPSRYGADSSLITVSGSSAGGALMLSATQAEALTTAMGQDTSFKAYVGFYPPIDLRPAPWEKPKPADNIIQNDPLSWLQPLYNSYAGPRKADMSNSPRMNPCLADAATLPKRMLIVIPRIDILPKELFDFVERVKRDDDARGDTTRTLETLYLEDMFHGFVEVPNWVVPWPKKKAAYDKAIALIRDAHREHGWVWEA
ncbi:hypothetical protein DV736_g4717, partial [Chaetothyriales sp. CBS 134916]